VSEKRREQDSLIPVWRKCLYLSVSGITIVLSEALLSVKSGSKRHTNRIYKDAQIRRFKAQVRKAKRELTEIAAVETQMAEKAELRIAKAAAAQSAALQKKAKKRDRNAPPAKKRRKRRYEADEGQQGLQ
jgi:hypothetical protein